MLPLRGNALLLISEQSYRVSIEMQCSERFAESSEIKTQLCNLTASGPKFETIHHTNTPVRVLTLAMPLFWS